MKTKQVIVLWLIWLIVVNLFALAALNRFNFKTDTSYTWIDANRFVQTQTWNPIPLHVHWDAFWYLDVAQNGYYLRETERLANIAFFPLYPGLVAAAGFLLAGNLPLAGWILSCIFLLCALIYLTKLVREFHPDIDPALPLVFLLVFPAAFFLNAVYAESLFLFLSIAAFYYAFKKKFLLASAFASAAALTRITGLLLFIPLIWEYASSYGWRQVLRLKFLPLLLVPLGTASFFFFHYLTFGDFFLFLKIQKWWGRSFAINTEHFLLPTPPAVVNLTIDVLFVVFTLIAIYFVFKKMRPSYGLYMIASILLPLSTGTLMSIGRYILVLFPIFILIAKIKNRYICGAYALVSLLFFALNITLFVNNYWAG